MADRIVYLNGKFLPIGKASISVLDRGFLFGDGVYEVVPVFGSHQLRVDEHLLRLQNSLNRVGISNPCSNSEWKNIFNTILEKNPGADRSIYLQITRGVEPIRDLSSQDDVSQTVFLMVSHHSPAQISQLEKGLEVVTLEDFRWNACEIKSISLIANVMLRQSANAEKVSDAILLRSGFVTEGTSSNVFIVKNNILITPPKSTHLLPGITRDLVLELAEQNKLPHEIREIPERELVDADEVWLTGSIREIAPVIKLNNKPVGKGAAGEVWRRMIDIYQQYKQQLRQV